MIGEALRLLRIFNGYKSVELAEKMGISQSYVSEIENNKKQPTMDILEKYANVFGMKRSTLQKLWKMMMEWKMVKSRK